MNTSVGEVGDKTAPADGVLLLKKLVNTDDLARLCW